MVGVECLQVGSRDGQLGPAPLPQRAGCLVSFDKEK